MKVAQIVNNDFTFGAHCIFDNDVKKIADSPTCTGTDYLREMFDTYEGKTPVLFTLTDNTDGKGRKIAAINLDNGHVYPERVTPNKAGLNNLMGFLMHGRSVRHDVFWYSPKRFNCNIEFIPEQDKATLRIGKANHFYVPYKTRIVDANGDVTIVHVYKNGYKTVVKKKDGKLSLLSILHKDLVTPLYNCAESEFNGVTISQKTARYYENLPTWLRSICMDSLDKLYKSLKK
ncbi:hypothetical protein J6P92_07320 [bacterium]|nr:hypothetical protein [bacterium]